MDMSSESGRAPSPFGSRLRQWRRRRGLSQLELAARAATTARHLSFLETGRSRPSRDMVLRLCEVIGVPLRERNNLLHAAGLEATFPEESLDSADLAPYRAAIDRIVKAHMPFRRWWSTRIGTSCSPTRPARRYMAAS